MNNTLIECSGLTGFIKGSWTGGKLKMARIQERKSYPLIDKNSKLQKKECVCKFQKDKS